MMQHNLVEPPDLRALSRSSAGGSRPLPPRPAYPWKSRLLLPTFIVLTLLGLLAFSARQALWPATPVKVVPVVVKPSVETTAGGTVTQAAGWVEADPFARAVTALADGVVKEVLVLEGQAVQAGQVVARLVDDDARLALSKAEAELAQRQAELTAAQRQWDHPIDRTRAVALADAMVAETQAELLKLDADVAAEAARVDDLAEQFEQVEKSYRSNAASEVEYVTLRQKLRAQRATLAATQARRPVLEAQLRQRQADQTAARENLRLRIEEAAALGASKAALAQAQAACDEARLRLSRMEIRAPAAGVVLSRHVEPGSKLMHGMDDPLSATAVRLYDPQRLQVRVDVPLADAAKVGVGAAAQVVVAVLPERTFDGVVTRVVHEADVAKNTLQVKVAIKDPSPQLKPEMLARVRLLAPPDAGAAAGTTGKTASVRQLVFAPESLVHREGETASVWVVDRADSLARRRQVGLGASRQEGWVSIESGLAPGDLLIAEPHHLAEGERVRVNGEAEPTKGGA